MKKEELSDEVSPFSHEFKLTPYERARERILSALKEKFGKVYGDIEVPAPNILSPQIEFRFDRLEDGMQFRVTSNLFEKCVFVYLNKKQLVYYLEVNSEYGNVVSLEAAWKRNPPISAVDACEIAETISIAKNHLSKIL